MEFFAFTWVTSPEIWVSLLTLLALEIVLGIDNLLFISILAERLPEHQRAKARKVGLALALITRLMLLAVLAWIVSLTAPFITVGKFALSWRDLILIGGGLFLLFKATHEIHNEVEGDEEDRGPGRTAASFGAVVSQIAIVDIVFSLDSVITAVGMADELWVMVVAVIAAMLVMIVASTPLARFIAAHPTVKMLALSFLLLIGVLLIAEGLHFHIPKGYVYFALAFSVMVEALNTWVQRRRRRARAAAAGR
ncbi:MAG: TerC family protein [Pseudomonadota bacterium]|nr:TerC family protein [Pseudomonadota bacterium]